MNCNNSGNFIEYLRLIDDQVNLNRVAKVSF